MADQPIDTADYDGRRTLIVGDVNSGKTRFTESILAAWTAQGRSQDIAVLDLAPKTDRGVGGRLHPPEGFRGIYRTAAVVPPRLQARSEAGADALAAANAAAIDPLLDDLRQAAGPIIVVNDATLYLQAGDDRRFLALIAARDTALINAYYGRSFPDYRLSRRERRLTERLMEACHHVIRLPR